MKALFHGIKPFFINFLKSTVHMTGLTLRRCSLRIHLWARVFTKTSPRWGFYQKPIWGFCRNLFYETPQIFSWGFYRNFNEVSRKNSPGSWGFYRNLFEVSVETYFMKQGSGVTSDFFWNWQMSTSEGLIDSLDITPDTVLVGCLF